MCSTALLLVLEFNLVIKATKNLYIRIMTNQHFAGVLSSRIRKLERSSANNVCENISGLMRKNSTLIYTEIGGKDILKLNYSQWKVARVWQITVNGTRMGILHGKWQGFNG